MSGKHLAGGKGPAGLKVARVLVACVMLGLLGAALADFRELVPVRLGHWLASVQLVPALVGLASGALLPVLVVGLIALVTLFFGRVYCSVVCPLGIFQDLVARVSKWLPGKRKPLPFRAERPWVRHLFVWLTVGGVLAGWSGFALGLADPYSHFGRIVSLVFRPLLTLANNAMVGVTEKFGWSSVYRVELPWAGFGALVLPAAVLSVVVVLAALRGRLYCNTFCPVGTVLGWIARRAAFRIGIDAGACTHCASCLRNCKAQCIDLKKGEVDFSRCVGCYNCVRACDEKGIGYKWSWGRMGKAEGGRLKAERRSQNPEARIQEGKAGEGATNGTNDTKVIGVDLGRRSWIGGNLAGLALGMGAFWGVRKAQAQEGYGEEGEEGRKSPDPKAIEGGGGSVGVAPPGARSVERFLARCTACQLCVSACPKHVLQPSLFEYGLQGFMKPRLDFTASFCDYDCNACGQACPDGAIEPLKVEFKQREQLGVARFCEDRCIVKVKNSDCAACSEHCPTKAVETVPYGDNLRIPKVNESLCIGCGACQFACPVLPRKAIEVFGSRIHGKAVRSVEETVPVKKPGGDFPF